MNKKEGPEIFILGSLPLCKTTHSPQKGCRREHPNVNNVSLWLELWAIFFFFYFLIFSEFSKLPIKKFLSGKR